MFKRNKLNITESSENASFQNSSLKATMTASACVGKVATKQVGDEDEELNMWLASDHAQKQKCNETEEKASVASDCSTTNETSLFVEPEV